MIYSFSGSFTGNNPLGDLFYDGTFLYGLTQGGGTNSRGTIFKIKKDGTSYIKLYEFNYSPDGHGPIGSLISDGIYLYGITENGGVNDNGTIFKIKNDGSAYMKIFDFASISTGDNPRGSLLYDGNFLYGLTYSGGLNNKGTIFRIKTDGTSFSKMYDFTNGNDGANPCGSFILNNNYLYATTFNGGINNNGTIFRIKTDGTNYLKLLDFKDTIHGNNPNGFLTCDGNYLYGMASNGGVNNFGTIYKLKTDGTGFIKLLNLSDTANGSYPYGGLLLKGTYLYGMTLNGGIYNEGTVFKIDSNGNNYEKIIDFDFGCGSAPFGSLITDGTYMYGMTTSGGANSNYGAIFKSDTMTVTGVKKILNNNEAILLYPNPTKDQITVEHNLKEKIKVELYDINGRLVLSKTINGTSAINVSDLDVGVYTVAVKWQDTTVNKRLIISR
ncbi:MAG: choice-of-anchor tandem repeat GloVer-containing protein [Bacteroidia bacterium]